MGRECLVGRMVEDIVEDILRGKRRGMVNSIGERLNGIRESGSKV
jgi:hypothetical protein